MATFGRITGAGTGEDWNNNSAIAFRLQATQNGRVTTMHMYASGTDPSVFAKGVLWNDNKTVYVVTEPVAIEGSTSWRVCTFNIPILIKKDVWYWIGAVSKSGVGEDLVGTWGGSYSGGGIDTTNSFSSPQTLGEISDLKGRSIYCTYTPLGDIDKLSGVNIENIDKFMGVDLADIAKIDGVDK